MDMEEQRREMALKQGLDMKDGAMDKVGDGEIRQGQIPRGERPGGETAN